MFRSWMAGLVVGVALFAVPGAVAHTPGLVFSATGTATVDGVLGTSEWQGAATFPFQANLPGGGTTPATLLVMNDASNIYLGVRLGIESSTTAVSFGFDNDHDGTWSEEGDDGVALGYMVLFGFNDWVIVTNGRGGCPSGATCGMSDTEVGGTRDGAAVRTVADGKTQFEISKPLDSADNANDFSVQPGDMLGFFLRVSIFGAPGGANTPTDPISNGDIAILPPVPPLHVTSNTTLTEDRQGSISIDADNVTLDCAGHRISGSGWSDTTHSGDFAGVSLYNRTGVTVRNCHISGFNEGILLSHSSGNTIENNTTADTGNAGIDLTDASSNNSVTGNTATTGDSQGFGVTRDSNANTLIGNTAASNGGGFYVDAANDNRLTGNTADRNGTGIQVNDGSHGNVLTGNTSTRNHSFGMAFGLGAYSNRMIGNTASLNDQSGFSVNQGAHDNLITANLANENGGGGFDLGSAGSGNRFFANRSLANLGGFMLNDSDGNSFANNTADNNQIQGFGLGLGSDDNSFINNNASGNQHGFYLANAASNLITRNHLANNNNGIELHGGTVGNELTGNTVNHNAGLGLALFSGSTNNNMQRNVAHANGIWDALDEGTGNTWLHDSFGTTSPADLG